MNRAGLASFTILYLLSTVFLSGLASEIQPVGASGGTIYIRSDGSVDPPTAPITRNGDVYTLTDNIAHDPSVGFGQHLIEIWRNNMTLDGAGYTVQGKSQSNIGIDLFGTSNLTIKNFTIQTFWCGIWLGDGSNNNIINNKITNNSKGVWLEDSSNNRISENKMYNNSESIHFQGSSSNYNSVSRNNITNNNIGLYLQYSRNNTISGNNIANNNWGIYVSYYAWDNSICHNDFIDNTRQASSSEDTSRNIWDNDYPSGGNYWSDYTGVDANGDGIGDTAYVIDANERDRYPLIRGALPHPQPTIKAVIINQYETNKLISFWEYVLFEIRYPIDCVIDVTISGYSPIKRVYLKVTGVTPVTIEMAKIAEGHYRVEIKPSEEPSAEDLRDIGYMILERLFDKILKGMGSLAPAPWSYSEPPDYVVTVDELVIEYQDETEFRKQSPVSPRQLPTYKDVLESMLPIWGSTDMPIGTTIVSMCPVDILVTDSLGKRVGAVCQNGQFVTTVNEIPESFYSGKDFTPEFIYIPNHSGQLTVQVVGVETGQYILDVLYQNQSGPALKEFSGSVVKGTIHNQQIMIIPEFSSFAVLPIFMIATLLTVAIYRRRGHNKECRCKGNLHHGFRGVSD